MSAHEIEAAIIRLTPQQLVGLLAWLETYHAQSECHVSADEPKHEQLDSRTDQPEDLYAVAD